MALTNVGRVLDLVRDPQDSNRLYATLPDAMQGANSAKGVYRSTNGGANWTYISNAAIAGAIVGSNDPKPHRSPIRCGFHSELCSWPIHAVSFVFDRRQWWRAPWCFSVKRRRCPMDIAQYSVQLESSSLGDFIIQPDKVNPGVFT